MNKKSYLYMLLDPRIHPITPFYIGIGHDEDIYNKDKYKRFKRPYYGHYLLQSIDFIKRKNKNNSYKLNKIIKIKEIGLEVEVFILHRGLTSQQAKLYEREYIKRFGRKGIDSEGTLTNVMPGGDGHDKLSSKYCRDFFEGSKDWSSSWMKDEEKVKLWKEHISKSSREDELKTHRRSKNMKNLNDFIWDDKEFHKKMSEKVSKKNKENWKDSEYRIKMCKKLKVLANTFERKKISSNNLKRTVTKLWKESEEFRKAVSERTKRKALINNSDITVMKRQQLFRLISMYYNKYKEYPWDTSKFNKKRSPALLDKLLEIFKTDRDWLIQRLLKLNYTIKSIEDFLKREGLLI